MSLNSFDSCLAMPVPFQDPHCKGILNAVIYCSVLKGFTREKNAGKVWSVYEARQSPACQSCFGGISLFA